MSGRAASTAGQATIEYLAIAVGVVAVAATLATVMPSLGERVTGAFACVIERVGGGGHDPWALRLLLRVLRTRPVLAERQLRRQADDGRRVQRRVPPPHARPLRPPAHRRARARLLRHRRHLLRGGLGRRDRESAQT
jgi:hypothetical protein